MTMSPRTSLFAFGSGARHVDKSLLKYTLPVTFLDSNRHRQNDCVDDRCRLKLSSTKLVEGQCGSKTVIFVAVTVFN